MKSSQGTPADHNGMSARPEWLPSQTWQARVAQRQIEAQVAKDEYKHQVAGRRRKIILAIGVAALTAIVVPLSIRTELSFADDIDPIHAYAEDQTQTSTLGKRMLEHAEATAESQPEPTGNAATGAEAPAEATAGTTSPAQGIAAENHAPAPSGETGGARGQATGTGANATSMYVQPLTPASSTPEDGQPAQEQPPMAEATAVVEQPTQQTQPQQPQIEQAQPQQTPPAAPLIKEWTSVPSWGSSAAPHYDALGKWDSNYYIAHNWTSYGEVILNMQPGEVIRVDGQLLVATKAEVFGSSTDYETVRDWCGWDAWCLQTCYGDNHVRIVALNPLAG